MTILGETIGCLVGYLIGYLVDRSDRRYLIGWLVDYLSDAFPADTGNLFHDLYTEAFEACDFARVVGQQADAVQVQART